MSTNISEGDNIGGFPYILNYLHIYLPYTAISSISGILGVAGNVFVIAAILSDRKLRRNPTFILITNLALSDLIISLVAHPSIFTGVFIGKKFFDHNRLVCVFIGAACFISCANSLITMGILAVNRFICIFHKQKYQKYFSVGKTLIMCLISWMNAIIADFPNHLGVGQHVFDEKNLVFS